MKTLTGEESQYEQQLEDGIQSSHRSLGIMSTEKIYRLLKVSFSNIIYFILSNGLNT